VQWMEKNQPNDEDLRRFRTEAAEVLGIQVPPVEQEKKIPPSEASSR